MSIDITVLTLSLTITEIITMMALCLMITDSVDLKSYDYRSLQ